MRKLFYFPLLLATAQFASAATPNISNWSITAKGGLAFPVMGEFSGSAAEATTTTTDEDGNEVVSGNSANILSLDWGDAYEDFLGFAVEVDFWETETRSLYLGVSYTQASGKTANLGSFDGRNVTATFSDYSDTGIYAGFRFGLGHSDWIKALFSIQAGANIVDSINANVTNIPGATTIAFYERSTVFGGGLLISVILTPLDFLEIGIESGFLYQTAPKGDSSQVNLLGLQGINSEGDLGLVPVRILATIKF